AFVTAAKSFPAFGTTGDIDVMKREIAAFLAQTAFQTAGARINDANAAEWGYCYKSFASDNSYCVPNNRYPCVEGERYYPRGAMQIGYNFNYGPAGDSIPEDLLANP
ncbi:glycoside hydrolase family 19 protein, partial [Oceanobacillus alkalisoli]|uniref:glycoside hydrolase family 19 protein n=1 Tax=Oceanobacillus alkalisoli TaxID=2925113 RepID=UPI002873729E